MYIKHMKLVCTTERQEVNGAAFLDIGPLRVLGSKEAFFFHIHRHQWPIGLSDHPRLFNMLQSVKVIMGNSLESPCDVCPQKVICLVSSHTENDYNWPKKICPHIKGTGGTLSDRKLLGEKVIYSKIRFVLEHKCNLCAFNACCTHYSLIARMLCTNFTKMDVLYEMAEKKITESWGSVERFMAGITAGNKEVLWKPPEKKRKRRYRVAFVHPDQNIELIQDYYPYPLRKAPVPAFKLGLIIPETVKTSPSKDDILTSWLLWRMMQGHVTHSRKWKHTGLGTLWISWHHNFLLSMYGDYSGHPVLVTSTSRWRYSTVFSDFDDIGLILGWSANQVKGCLED